MADTALLIVRQRPVPHAELENLVSELQAKFHLDPYTTRQRLLGPGLTQLLQGEQERLEEMADSIRRHAHPCWVTAPVRPRFAPPRLRGLTIGDGAVEFHCEGEKVVRLERGVAAVGVLADISGELAGKQVKRMLARNAYLGRGQTIVATPDNLRADVLRGQPVFDCYLPAAEGTVIAAFRVLPGRFNPEGLGGRAGLGSAHNLEAIIDLVGEYAGVFRLHTDFGLSQLPGALPQPTRDDPAALTRNLEALTRFGWLVASLTEPSAGGRVAGDIPPGTVMATGLAGVAAGAGVMLTSEELGKMATAINEAASDSPVADGSPAPIPLPSPPSRPDQKFSLRRALPFIAVAFGGMVLVVSKKSAALHPCYEYSVLSGALPGVVAVATAWWGFACLRLKRHIDDTPTSRIRSLAMGLVEVQGRAIRQYALVSPMSQAACVWYRLCRYRRDNSNRWQLTSQSDSGHVPFVLADGSGQVVIDPAGATVKSRTEQTGYPGESSLTGAALDGGPDEKWVEELIYEGTTLYVLGYARPARGVAPGLRERTVEKLRQLKLDPGALGRYDANGDGRLDAEEWQSAREEVERQAAVEQLGAGKAAGLPVLLGKPPAGLPFLIAEGQNGTQLAGRYGWLGGALLVAATVVFALALKLSLEFFQGR